MRARAPLTLAMTAAMAAAMAAPATAQADDEPDARRRIAVLEFRSGSSELPAIDRRTAAVLREKTSLVVLDADDARRTYGPHLDHDVVACGGEPRCIAGVGKRLGADEVLLVGVSEFGDVILTMQRIDAARGRVHARVAEALAPGAAPDEDALTRYLHRVLPKTDFLRYGIIHIDANVPDATVVVGTTQRGKTPLAPIRVQAPATYDIVLTKPGYVDFRASIAVPPDAEVNVRPVLARHGDDAWYTRWWVVAAAGVVVVGAVTVAVVVTRDDPQDVRVVLPPF
jgi:hypothetical protein